MSRPRRTISSRFRALRTHAATVALAAIAAHSAATAQEVGGYSGAFLQRSGGARANALGGIVIPFRADASSLFGNAAALAGLDGRGVSLSASALPFGEELYAASFATPLGTTAGFGAGIVGYGIGNIEAYDENGVHTGTTNSRELAVTAAGGLRIGQGAVGATLHYLRFDARGAEGASGYAVDLSGTLEFDRAFTGHDWVIAGVSLGNIAGEQTAHHWQASPDARISAGWVLPFEPDTYVSDRIDPIGVPLEHRRKPRSYLLIAAGTRLTRFDWLPASVSLAAEWALPESIIPTPIALRLGWNSRSSFAAGFSLRLPQNIVIDASASRDVIGTAIAGSATVGLVW